MSTREARRATFDAVAEQYDKYRPGYPEQLIEDVIELSGLPPGGRVLEIGSGTGKATLPFAQRGFEITCIERGANLARVALRHLAGYPNVRLVVTDFEDWESSDGEQDLVFAAQSFHFLEYRTAVHRIAQLLRIDGALAVFGNHASRGDSAVDKEIQAAYSQYGPELTGGDDEPPFEDRIDSVGVFGTVIMTRYRWRKAYTADDYVGLMETQSPHRLLPADRRDALLAAIRSAIESSGSAFEVEYVSRLYLAKRLAL